MLTILIIAITTSFLGVWWNIERNSRREYKIRLAKQYDKLREEYLENKFKEVTKDGWRNK